MAPSPRKVDLQIVSDVSETSEISTQENEHPSRAERLAKHKMQCENLIMYLTSNKYPEDLTKNEVRNLRNQAKTHLWDSTRQELVYVGSKKNSRKKVVTELKEIQDILHQYHSNPMGGHSGINNTLSKISNFYLWIGMKEDVVEYCKSCDRCQRYEKLKTMAPELKCIKVNKAMELVGMDLIGPLPTTTAGYKFVLTFTDYYTKFVDFYPLKEKAAGGVARSIKTFVCRWGAPCRLLSDQGREFVAKVNAEICKQLGISRSVTSAYHPQTNGLDERTNQTLKVRLAKLINEHQDDWDDYLEEIAFSIRTQKQGSTKYSPFFLMFGRHARTPMEMEEPSEEGDIKPEDPSAEEYEEMVAERSDMMENVGKKVEENVEKAQVKQKKEYAKKKNKGVKVFNLSVGDLVLRKCMKNTGRKGGKLDALWTGPYRIVEIDNNQRIQLAHIESGETLKVKVPYDQVRPHVTSDLHRPVVPEDSNNPDSSSCADKMDNNVPSNQPAVPSPLENSQGSPTFTMESLKDHKASVTNIPNRADEDIEIVAHTKAKKRKAGPLPAKKANLKKNVAQLLPDIQNGEWLSDEHIDHAQAMLAKQFPKIGGLQTVCVFVPEGCQRVGTPEQSFVQVLNIGGNHWITVSNVGSPKDTVVIYDSLYNNINASYKEKFLRQIAYMLMPTSKCMTLLWADMQKQEGTSDCGLFAVAVATSLCSGVLPQNCVWQQEKMRGHLVKCIEASVISPFPTSNTRQIHQSYHSSEEIEVYCHCRQPYRKNIFMVQCDKCLEWFHRGCERVPRVIKKDRCFCCKKCK